MRRLRSLFRLVVAVFLAGSAASVLPFIEFLDHGGQELVALAQEHGVGINASRLGRLSWEANLTGNGDDLHVGLEWGSLAEAYRNDPAVNRDGLIEYGAESGAYSVRWVSHDFSLVVTQRDQFSGSEPAKRLVQGLRTDRLTTPSYRGRLVAYSSSARYTGLRLSQAFAILRAGEGERWETVLLAFLSEIGQIARQALVTWQLPAIAAMPSSAIPVIAWAWAAALTGASLALFAPRQSARLCGMLRKALGALHP